MKEKLRILPMKALAAFALILIFSPVTILLGRHFLPDERVYWYVLPVICAAWALLGCLPSSKFIRILFPVVGLAALIAFGITALVPAGGLRMLFLIPCAALILMIPTAWSSFTWEEWHSGLWIAGALAHLVAQFLATGTVFTGISFPLGIACTLYAFLLVLMLNGLGIRSGMHGSQKAPPALRRQNRLLAIALFIPAFIISIWGPIANALNTVWYFILFLVDKIIAFLLSLYPQSSDAPQEGGGGNQMEMLLGLDSAEPSDFALLMEKIMMWVGVALLLVALVFLLIFIGKLFIRIWKKIMEKLKKYASSALEDYIDEEESTLNLDEKTKALKEKLQKVFNPGPRQKPWDELTGRERVRRLYQQFLKKKPDAQPLTAREALAQDKWLAPENAKKFTELYERARYSDHDVSTQEADQLKNIIK